MTALFFAAWAISILALCAYIQKKYDQGLSEGKEIGWKQGRAFERNGCKINFDISFHYVGKEEEPANG